MEPGNNTMKVMITGVTGMVGEGVLHVCIEDSSISEILVLGRRPYNIEHPKVKQHIVGDFMELKPAEHLRGYHACYFCSGVSSVGMKEEAFTHLTYDLTMHVARVLLEDNPEMVFCYVSGAGTDSTEQGRQMWARVKGRTENHLAALGFKAEYNFRPGVIKPMKGMQNTLSFYKYLGWLIPAIRAIAPKLVITLREIGQAMIEATRNGYPKTVLEVTDIRVLAERYEQQS